MNIALNSLDHSQGPAPCIVAKHPRCSTAVGQWPKSCSANYLPSEYSGIKSSIVSYMLPAPLSFVPVCDVVSPSPRKQQTVSSWSRVRRAASEPLPSAEPGCVSYRWL